jgi:hypothetical protein
LQAFLFSTGVVAGTTLGMLVADVPVVLIGNASSGEDPDQSDPNRRRADVCSARNLHAARGPGGIAPV